MLTEASPYRRVPHTQQQHQHHHGVAAVRDAPHDAVVGRAAQLLAQCHRRVAVHADKAPKRGYHNNFIGGGLDEVKRTGVVDERLCGLQNHLHIAVCLHPGDHPAQKIQQEKLGHEEQSDESDENAVVVQTHANQNGVEAVEPMKKGNCIAQTSTLKEFNVFEIEYNGRYAEKIGCQEE